MVYIDVNCDLGENAGDDTAIMPFISSANIACGYHAGDEVAMRTAIECALQHNVAIGAHPGFKDKENFGRTEMQLSFNEVYNLVAEQVLTLQEITCGYHTTLHHVKPHGALYNMAAKDKTMAAAIAKAVKNAGENIILYGFAGSCLISEAKKINLHTANEVFADRRYNADGSLVARSNASALLENDDEAIAQVIDMIKNSYVTTIAGTVIPVQAETVCLHGDSKQAVLFASKIFEALKQYDIILKAI
jgi:UPF0271 protein